MGGNTVDPVLMQQKVCVIVRVPFGRGKMVIPGTTACI